MYDSAALEAGSGAQFTVGIVYPSGHGRGASICSLG